MKIIAKNSQVFEQGNGGELQKIKITKQTTELQTVFKPPCRINNLTSIAHFNTVRYCVNSYDVILINDPME